MKTDHDGSAMPAIAGPGLFTATITRRSMLSILPGVAVISAAANPDSDILSNAARLTVLRSAWRDNDRRRVDLLELYEATLPEMPNGLRKDHPACLKIQNDHFRQIGLSQLIETQDELWCEISGLANHLASFHAVTVDGLMAKAAASRDGILHEDCQTLGASILDDLMYVLPSASASVAV